MILRKYAFAIAENHKFVLADARIGRYAVRDVGVAAVERIVLRLRLGYGNGFEPETAVRGAQFVERAAVCDEVACRR
jgi:hypothetical protein